jgi:hypothetical protein
MARDLGAMRGAYLLARALRAWTRDELVTWIGAAAECGIDTVITKVDAVTPELIAACHAHDIAVLGSLACFSDHAGPTERNEHRRPIDDRGQRFRPMEWYTGLIPTEDAYNDELVRRCGDACRIDGITGIALDFLRWPGHWELELRPGALPRRSSFDPITLRTFRDHLAGHGRPDGGFDPDDAAGAARFIANHLPDAWTAFRCDTIVQVATRLTAEIRAAGLASGLFVVPAEPGELRTVVGQDVARLGALVDVLLPMTYHAIMLRDATWPSTIVDALRAATTTPVVPMLQTTADRRFSGGYDWGPPIAPGQFATALASIEPAGYCVFPGEGLDSARFKILALTNAVRSNARTSSPERRTSDD